MASDMISQYSTLDPDWKVKLARCIRELGLLDGTPFTQMTIRIAEFKVVEIDKQIRYK